MSYKTIIDKMSHNIQNIVIDFEKETFSITIGKNVKVVGIFKTRAITTEGMIQLFVEVFPETKGNPKKLIGTVSTIISNHIIQISENVLLKVMPKTIN